MRNPPSPSKSLRFASLAVCWRVARFRFSGADASSYWPFDDSEVGAVVCIAEFVRSPESVEPIGVVFWRGVFPCEATY